MGCRFQPRLRLTSLPKFRFKRTSFHLEYHFEGNQMRTTISLIQSCRNAPATLLNEAETLNERSNEPCRNLGRPFQTIWRRREAADSWRRNSTRRLAETGTWTNFQRRFAPIHVSTDSEHPFDEDWRLFAINHVTHG